MRTNLSIKALSLLLAGMMTFGLASCKDDELIPDIDEPDVNIPIPTEDEVKTTVGKTYAVLGDQFDEVTPYVMKRMTGQRYNYTPADTEIADDVEVVFMDTKALTGMHKEMAYELKELYDRNGFIYMHKPNALALAFFQMLVNDELDDFMEWMEENTGGGKIDTRTAQDGDPLTRDSYILSRNSSLDMQDIYDGKEITREATVTEVDENGKEQFYFPADGAMVTAPGCGHMMYGQITQIDYGSADHKSYAAPRVAKFILDQPNDSRSLRLACRPLAAPHNYCPYIFAPQVVG